MEMDLLNCLFTAFLGCAGLLVAVVALGGIYRFANKNDDDRE